MSLSATHPNDLDKQLVEPLPEPRCKECDKPLREGSAYWSQSGVCSRRCWGDLNMETP